MTQRTLSGSTCAAIGSTLLRDSGDISPVDVQPKRSASNRHSRIGCDDHRGMARGFLPRGLSDTSPQIRAMRGIVPSHGQVSDNP